jgi:hypothetical protein
MELASFFRSIGISISLIIVVFSTSSRVVASESAVDCGSASKTLSAGLQVQPDDTLVLFLDSLRTNPGCRRNLLITAVEASKADSVMIKNLIFIARQEFPTDQSLFAEAALGAAPEHIDTIRNAFMADDEVMKESLRAYEEEPQLVVMPPEVQVMNEDLREAIARMTAKVEGKHWPEQNVGSEPVKYKRSDEIRVSRDSKRADETSLENSIPIDTADEQKITTTQLRINDHWEKGDEIRLDETKFVKETRGDSRSLREARKREISTAGAVGFPKRPVLRRPSYYIPPSRGDYRSTIDLDDNERHRLIIRPSTGIQAVGAKRFAPEKKR